MTEKRKAFPAFNTFREFVRNELNRRRNTFPTPTMTPFVRMTSGKQDLIYNYKFFSLGLHGWEDSDAIFDLTYGGQDIVGYAVRNGRRTKITSTQSVSTQNMIAAGGHHPIPGITSVRVDWKGPKDPVSADITWRCYNTTQLEFLRPHFLMAGGYIVIEWGYEFSDGQFHSRLNFAADDAEDVISRLLTGGRTAIIDNYVAASNGNYNFLIAQITNQSITFTEDNGFECTTSVMGTAESIWGLGSNSAAAPSINDIDKTESSTINDFFKPNGVYDQILNDDTIIPPSEKVLHIRRAEHNINDIDASLPDSALRFISWNAFFTTVIAQLFSFISSPDSIKTLFNVWYGKDFLDVLSTKSGDIYSIPPNSPSIEDAPLVRTHHKLLTTDPSILVINSPFITPKTPLFPTDKDHMIPIVDSLLFPLGQGIWLNAQAISDSFLSTNTFVDGLNQLLTKINNAVGNFWNLGLGWDDEKHRYIIYDSNTVYDNSNNILLGSGTPIYIFNQSVRGELLSLEFTSTYTQMVKAAVLLGSQLSNPFTKNGLGAYKDLIQYTSTIGATNAGYAQVVNSSPIPDLLEAKIASIYSTMSQPENLSVNAATPVDKSSTGYAITQPNSIPIGTVSSNNTTNAEEMGFNLQRDRQNADVLPSDSIARQRQQQKEEELKAKEKTRVDFDSKFGTTMESYVNFNVASQSVAIRNDGIQNPSQPNNFVAPIPTDIQMSLTINGIGGISMFDYFLVDKLPELYKKYGVFLVTGITDTITAEGWRTELSAMYYYCWNDGLGPPFLRGTTSG